jgi:hypothetical protein
LRCVLAAVALSAAACAGTDFDRDRAVADAIEASDGRWTTEQASCYVDRVADELGRGALRPDAELAPEQLGRLTTIRVDCVGVTNLGTDPPSGTTVPSEQPGGDRPPPERPDPEQSRLRAECAEGYGVACDELFDRAPLGSGDERFAATCGGRSREVRCAEVYPEPGVALPSSAQPTTTVPPPAP